MLFLLRTAFWVCVGLALVATFAPGQPSTSPPQMTAGDAVDAVWGTYADLSQLCERRPDACAAGTRFVGAVAQRVEEGAKITYNFFFGARLAKQNRPEEQYRRDRFDTVTGFPEITPAAALKSQHTLTFADTAPPWRGPPRWDASDKHGS
jgi:hypothetical protein